MLLLWGQFKLEIAGRIPRPFVLAMLKRLCIVAGMTPSELITHLEKQIVTRGLDPLSFEQMDLIESENPSDAAELEGMLEDLRDRVGLEIPAEFFSTVSDEERANGPRR